MTTATPRSGPVPAQAVPKPGPPPGRAAAASGAGTPPRVAPGPAAPGRAPTKARPALARHEPGAGHAATGYAQATGRVGVCMATSGPGATNLVTPLADAHMDSVPIVAITGQVGAAQIGTDAF